MNLTLFFRLILMSVFQDMVKYYSKDLSYDRSLFYCPRVFANDGFNVSLQINYGNYCSSNNGYRTLGDTMINVEFGFPSLNEPLMFEHSEMWSDDAINFDVTSSAGSIPISVMEEVFAKHGGIDWDKTISIDAFNEAIKD